MCSVRKSVLRNFAKFTGKHLCQGLFFNKVTSLRLATLLKKRIWHRCFPVHFPVHTISKNTFFIEHLWTTASVCSLVEVRFDISSFVCDLAGNNQLNPFSLQISLQPQGKQVLREINDIHKLQKQPARGVLRKSCKATLLKSHFGMGVLL